jgi:hypothetical protein
MTWLRYSYLYVWACFGHGPIRHRSDKEQQNGASGGLDEQGCKNGGRLALRRSMSDEETKLECVAASSGWGPNSMAEMERRHCRSMGGGGTTKVEMDREEEEVAAMMLCGGLQCVGRR